MKITLDNSSSFTVELASGKVIKLSNYYLEKLFKDEKDNLISDDWMLSKRDIELLDRGKRIAAIKNVRDRTGWSIKESKQHVDSYMLMN